MLSCSGVLCNLNVKGCINSGEMAAELVDKRCLSLSYRLQVNEDANCLLLVHFNLNEGATISRSLYQENKLGLTS